MAILKDAWQLYNSLTLCDDSKKGVRTELRRWELHLSHLEQREISSIKKLDLARLRCHLEKKNLSPQTIYHCLSLLRRVLYTAKEYELSDTKLPSFQMPKVKNQRYRFLSIDEANMLITCLSNRKFFSSMLWRDLTVVSLNTGLRPNELFNLRRCHISLKNKIIYVAESKNGDSGYIKMKPIVASICQKHLPGSREALLFHKENGESFTQAGSPFRRAVKLCRFNEDITDPLYKVVFYTLRHTFASWLVMQGVPLYSVGKMLGHKTTIMTQRYAHLSPDYMNSIDKLPDFDIKI